ncbi:MAG: NAD(P)H-binding protein [Porphyromonadaceae bacterium]|jgi:uncharacterized protein YbjT (DUF2867 family)|nr:NAD(P)H-binding protein [Porphyromonadaceae bacterium]
MKTAIVIGSTGLVGTELISQLLDNLDYTEIISLVRRKSGVEHSKLTEHIVDFDKPDKWREFVKGDVLFSTMGTTLKTAGSKENQFKVDYTYQFETAKIANENGVPAYVLVSSVGANSKSPFFYSKIKGQLEDAVRKLPFNSIHILQPGPLDGERKENRKMEKVSLKVINLLNSIGIFRRYRPILGSEVAKAMISIAENPVSGIYKLDELFKL